MNIPKHCLPRVASLTAGRDDRAVVIVVDGTSDGKGGVNVSGGFDTNAKVDKAWPTRTAMVLANTIVRVVISIAISDLKIKTRTNLHRA